MNLKKNTIGILTFHHATNPGAYLQCLALVETLKTLGQKPEVINYINLHHLIDEWKGLLSTINPKVFYNTLKRIYKFHKARKMLPLSPLCFSKNKISNNYYDIAILGSDIIWDFKNLSFGFDPVYFGRNINTENLFSYAASFGQIKKNEIIPQEAQALLRGFNKISVRDKNSLKIIESLNITHPHLVLDPVFLYDFSSYEVPCNKSNYILVYSYLMDDIWKAELKDFANEKGLKIIAVGYSQPWCDANILEISPFEWLGYFRNAQYVVTSTFHGVIFAVKYEKQFIAFAKDGLNDKVKDMACILLDSRILGGGETVMNIINENIDYKYTRDMLNSLIENSLQFLKEILRK